LLLKSLKRKGKPTKRKYPVTVPMMKRVKWLLFSDAPAAIAARAEADVAVADATVVWAGCTTAFFFMLRGGEWLAHDGRGYDAAKVIVGAGVVGYRAGAKVDTLSQANEVAVEVRASKVDQHNVGTWRNHYMSGLEVCPVAALADLQRQFPQRFTRGSEALKPLFRRASGAPVLASQVKVLLRHAAEREGIPVDRMGTHSLRIGGATALLHGKVPIELIKRMGRWVSESFQRYLWEANEDAKDLARIMASDTSTLAVTRQDPGGR